MNQVTTVATVMTKVTAIPIPSEVSTFLETPMKGQMPRNRANTKLLTKTALTRIRKSSTMGHTFSGKLPTNGAGDKWSDQRL